MSNDLLVGPSNVHLFHRAFLCETPGPAHAKLYDAFPSVRGVSSSALDVDIFEATVVMALTLTFPKGQQKDPFRCFLFVPGSKEKWAIEHLQTFAKRLFDGLKKRKAEQRAEAARHLGRFFSATLLGSKVLQLQAEPDRWVAFGFEKSNPIPEWMGSHLAEFVS